MNAPRRDDEQDKGGQVVPFPGAAQVPDVSQGGEVEPAPEVFEAELVDEQDDTQRAAVQRYVPPPLVVVQRVVVVVRPRTTNAGKATLRAGVTIAQGFGSWVGRAWDEMTLGVYRRAIEAAEAAGDHDRLVDWTTRHQQVKDKRHQRMLNAPKLVVGGGIIAGICLLGLVVLVVLAGLVVQLTGAGTFLGVMHGALDGIRWVIAAVPVAAGVLLVAGPPAVLAAAWREGKRRGSVPTWLAAPRGDGDVMDQLPDEGTIVNALNNLGIPGFTKAIKGGWRLHFAMPPVMDEKGKGWLAEIDLPPASPVVEFVKRKPTLAHNLRRFPVEVWLTEPRPGVLGMWVAKPGALSGPVDPWPLLADLDNPTADYFAGVPVGVTVKGDVVTGRLFETNWVAGGVMGSGKSTLVITALLGAMLDPLVELDVVVMADNADYEPMRPRLRSLVTGAGEGTVTACLGMLHELYEELSLRGQALQEHDERAVTRKLALTDERLRPRIMVIDECQNLFLGEHGKPAFEVVSKLMSTARKYAITLMFLTPLPSAESLPRKIVAIASNKACFAIGDQLGNDAVLGTGSYKAGISAVGLVPKTDEGPGDVGTCMQRGFTTKPGLLRSFYVEQDDAHRVTRRAVQLRTEHGVRAAALVVPEPVDHLANIGEALRGEHRVRTQVVLARLAERNPAVYESWTFSDLKAVLAQHPAIDKDARYNGTQVVRLEEVAQALTERDQ